MSSRKCPDCTQPIKICRELGGCQPKPERVEAFGVKGMASKPWRRTFASPMALHAWAEKNSAVVHGQRFLDAGDAPLSSVERKDLAAAKERQQVAQAKAVRS